MTVEQQQPTLRGNRSSKPKHLQELEKYLDLGSFTRQFERMVLNLRGFNQITQLKLSQLVPLLETSNVTLTQTQLPLTPQKPDQPKSDQLTNLTPPSSSKQQPNLSSPLQNESPHQLPFASMTTELSSSFTTPSKEMAPGSSVDSAPIFSSFFDSYNYESIHPETKRIKLDSKLLDDIKYDATLPDKILQSELSSDASEIEPSLTPSVSDEISFANQLSDDTYNTEGSSGSVLSQCASQPAHCVTEPTTVTEIKCMTAPTTPTNSRPNSPSFVESSSKKTKKIFKTKSNLSREVNMTMKRRKIWTSIAQKEIPRAQKRRFSLRRKTLATCRKISRMAVPSDSPEPDEAETD